MSALVFSYFHNIIFVSVQNINKSKRPAHARLVQVEDSSADGVAMILHIVETRRSQGSYSNRIVSPERLRWAMAKSVRELQREILGKLKIKNGVVSRIARRVFRDFANGIASVQSIHDISSYMDMLPDIVRNSGLRSFGR